MFSHLKVVVEGGLTVKELVMIMRVKDASLKDWARTYPEILAIDRQLVL